MPIKETKMNDRLPIPERISSKVINGQYVSYILKTNKINSHNMEWSQTVLESVVTNYDVVSSKSWKENGSDDSSVKKKFGRYRCVVKIFWFVRLLRIENHYNE